MNTPAEGARHIRFLDNPNFGLRDGWSLSQPLMSKSVHSKRHHMIATALADQRRSKGLTQAQVAKALGRHQPFIANIESGERRVDLVELLDIASIIGLDVEALVRSLSLSKP